MTTLTFKGTDDIQVRYGETMEIRSSHPFTLIGLDEQDKPAFVIGTSVNNYLKYRNFDYSFVRIQTDKQAITSCQTHVSADTAEVVDSEPLILPTERKVTMFDRVKAYVEGAMSAQADKDDNDTFQSFNDFTVKNDGEMFEMPSEYQFDEMTDEVPIQEAVDYAKAIGDKRRQEELEQQKNAQNQSDGDSD
jgi:hypothetical protein